MCSGTIGTPLPKLWVKYVKIKRGLGALSLIRAVKSSSAMASSTQVSMSVLNNKSGALDLSILMVKTKSRTVQGRPSLHSTPGRIFTVTSV